MQLSPDPDDPFVTEVGDAEQAYPQAKPNGSSRTWLRLPLELQPPEWQGKCQDPVVEMEQALYGHPDAGGRWEQHSESKILLEQLVRIENMPSVFWHDQLELMLIMYVDDFKVSR